MTKTKEELEAMGLGELILYAEATGCKVKVMNDLVTKREVLEAILARKDAPDEHSGKE